MGRWPTVNSLDVLLVLLLGLWIYTGGDAGFLLQGFSLGGLLLGLVAGALLAPAAWTGSANDCPAAHAALGDRALVALAGVGDLRSGSSSAGRFAHAWARRPRGAWTRGRRGDVRDTLLVATWFLGAQPGGRAVPRLARSLQDSASSGPSGALPPPPPLLEQIGRLADRFGFPDLFSGCPRRPASRYRLPTDPDVRAAREAARASTFEVLGKRCESGFLNEGTGFVVAPRLHADQRPRRGGSRRGPLGPGRADATIDANLVRSIPSWMLAVLYASISDRAAAAPHARRGRRGDGRGGARVPGWAARSRLSRRRVRRRSKPWVATSTGTGASTRGSTSCRPRCGAGTAEGRSCSPTGASPAWCSPRRSPTADGVRDRRIGGRAIVDRARGPHDPGRPGQMRAVSRQALTEISAPAARMPGRSDRQPSPGSGTVNTIRLEREERRAGTGDADRDRPGPAVARASREPLGTERVDVPDAGDHRERAAGARDAGSAPRPRARVRCRLNTASLSGTSSGSAARASSVDERTSGTSTTGSSASLTSSRTTASPVAMVSPPSNAAAALSGCPSTPTADDRMSSAPRLEPQEPVRQQHAGDRSRGGRAQAPLERYRVPGARATVRGAACPRPPPPLPSFGRSGRSRRWEARRALPLPRDAGSASVSTVTSLQRSSARPKQSNPGPRFAEVAGTRTVTRIVGGAYPRD